MEPLIPERYIMLKFKTLLAQSDGSQSVCVQLCGGSGLETLLLVV